MLEDFVTLVRKDASLGWDSTKAANGEKLNLRYICITFFFFEFIGFIVIGYCCW